MTHSAAPSKRCAWQARKGSAELLKQIKDLREQHNALMTIEQQAEGAFWRSYDSCDKVVRSLHLCVAPGCFCSGGCVCACVFCV